MKKILIRNYSNEQVVIGKSISPSGDTSPSGFPTTGINKNKKDKSKSVIFNFFMVLISFYYIICETYLYYKKRIKKCT